MGVTVNLRLVDHLHVVELGLPAVARAVALGNPGILTDFIATIPFVPNPELISYREMRLAKLREFNAPSIIIQNEERMFRLTNGDAYSLNELSTKSLDELRGILATFGWLQNAFDLSTDWYPLDWFLQPSDGPDEYLLFPVRPPVGDPSQTLLDHALWGSQKSPLDSTGSPMIRTCGSNEKDIFDTIRPSSIRSSLTPSRRSMSKIGTN